MILVENISDIEDYQLIEHYVPLQGYRICVAVSYLFFNVIGFIVNLWVLYVVVPLLFANNVRVPKSILLYIMILCISDLFTMTGMTFLVTEVILGTWKFSATACTAYLVFDSLNKFMAPIIALLISRTCYATVCLNKKYQERAANLKFALFQVTIAIILVMIVLWPVFAYSGPYTFYFNPDNVSKSVRVMRKCNFAPPPSVELGFSIAAAIANYAIPLGGILYWYMSVPLFLRRRAETTLVGKTGISETAIRKVITTALMLTLVYVLCWSPYWVVLFAHQLLSDNMSQRSIVIIGYYIHMLPYISCAVYPLIFTFMNKTIKDAHVQLIMQQRRRLRSLTGDAARHVRQSVSALQEINVPVFFRRLSVQNPMQEELPSNSTAKYEKVSPSPSTHLTTEGNSSQQEVQNCLENRIEGALESIDNDHDAEVIEVLL